MKEQELQEIKAKNKGLMAKACVYTNLAYALVEAAEYNARCRKYA